MISEEIKGAWLTVNRACNLRCLWCYAKDTFYQGKDQMSLDFAKTLLKLQKDIGVEQVIILGGEPTIWSPLFKTIRYAKELGMRTILVSNGLKFAKSNFLSEYLKTGCDELSISIKAGSKEQYKKLTGIDAYNNVLRAVENLRNIQVNFSINITLTTLLADNIDKIVKNFVDAGAQDFGIDVCTITFENDKAIKGFKLGFQETVDCITQKYDTMNKSTEGRIAFEMSVPFCRWPHEFLETLAGRGQITVGCHVLTGQGLIFDPSGKLLLCNNMPNVPIGMFGQDFSDIKSFKKFWNSKELYNVHNQLTRYPSDVCADCDTYSQCGGGCPLQWFVFDPQSEISNKGGDVLCCNMQ